jgi:hypothetical protein
MQNKYIAEANESLLEAVQVNSLLCKLPPFGAKVYRFPNGHDRMYFTVEGKTATLYSGLTGYIDKFYSRPGEKAALINYQIKQGDHYEDELEATSLFGSFGHAAIAQFITEGALDPVELMSDFRAYCLHTGLPIIRFPKLWRRMWKAMQSFAQFCADREVEALATEYCVYDKNRMIATPLDLVCRMKFDKKTITANINFKFRENPNVYKKDQIQVFCETSMFNSRFSGTEYEVTHGFIWMPSDFRNAPTYHLKNVTEDYSDSLWEIDHKILLMKGIHKPDLQEEYLSPNVGLLKLGEAPNPQKETVEQFCLRFAKPTSK